MLKIKTYDYLVNWKKTKNKKTLLINGARQAGKTFIFREFGKNEFKNFIEISFVKDPN